MNALTPALIQSTEHTFKSFDDTELFYRAWHPTSPSTQAIVLFHGGHEHSGRFDELAEKLALPQTSIFAWDARGHGRSPGTRGYADNFMDLVRDANAFMQHISARYAIPTENMVCLGHSVGSVIVSTWLHDYAPQVRGAVLGSPAFDIKLYVPLAKSGLKVWQKVQPGGFVNSYVRPGMLTHDAQEAEARRHDPLISPKISLRVLTSLRETANRIVQNASAIETPLLMLCAGNDYVVHHKAQKTFFDGLSSSVKEMVIYDGFYHEIFHEAERERPIAKAKAFIKERFANPAPEQKVVQRNNATYRALQEPLPALSPRRLKYKIARLSLSTAGRLSRGIQVGWRSGFDSGSMLNYVYANKAHGITPIGKWLDRLYLDTPGWAGIRQRGKNLQTALRWAIDQNAQQDRLQIMDVAAGPGRYILDILEDAQDPRLHAICRDWDETGLNEGRELAASRGLTQIVYEKGDAFDPASLTDTLLPSNIVIVSGLYELFSDNDLILQSLHGIHDAMTEDGVLIYTNQPTHPQLEFIARTLTNRNGEPWVMRLRSQREMNALVTHAGFTPHSMAIDNDGIFTVSIAHKNPS